MRAGSEPVGPGRLHPLWAARLGRNPRPAHRRPANGHRPVHPRHQPGATANPQDQNGGHPKKLEQAQAAPEAQRPAILQGLTGDHLTGDLLTATIWGYFAALQSHGAIASAQAQMVDRPALSYGLFHAQVKPNKLYGIVTTGITFQGLNMDIGHLRHTRWVKNDDPQRPHQQQTRTDRQRQKPAAQNRWIAYNKMRGQYASAMEHAVPEQFWVDKSQCRYTDENGQRSRTPPRQTARKPYQQSKPLPLRRRKGRRSTPSTRATQPRPCQSCRWAAQWGRKFSLSRSGGQGSDGA
jgi:hypothetical protein